METVDRFIIYLKDSSERKLLLWLLLITFGLRLYAVLMASGIANDSASYGFMARDFLRGDWREALSPAFHPLYPYLISLLSPSAASVEITGRLISLAFGTFALIPVFYLMKDAFGQRVAVLSGLLYCFHPYLVTYSGMLLSEATYWGFLAFSIYFFWFGMQRGQFYRILVAGVLLGLAYLTRPEGIGFLFVFMFWIVFAERVMKDWFRKSLLIGALILTVCIPAAPYVIFIHHESGQWLISKKAIQAQPRVIPWDGEKSPNPNIKTLSGGDPVRKSFNVRTILRSCLNFLPFTVYHYLRAYHFALWLPLFFGLLMARRWNRKGEWFFGSFILFHLVSLATFVPSATRFSVPLVPISLFWAGTGVLELQRSLKERNVPNPERWIFYLLVLLLLVQMPQILTPERRHREEQKNVGLWLKQNTPEDALIMSNSPQEAFYAIRRFVWLPPVKRPRDAGRSYEDVVRFAREKGVRYVVVNRYTREASADFVDSIPSPEVKEFYRYKDMRGETTLVYEIVQ